ncbi:stage III sporulation protein AG [Gottschalkia purinilytica]|uniref:Stage III sporulation protein AG n=1 Tax=Gottschalkia purinilytica TaxID=1503 RepID=A0A0L0W7F9_GOTPU|nr:sporulation stage III protein AG [Gottschalkia purinilytica]KNF07397.1 stage III sporulation protein AG [Gottschalkia purinilytica]
MIEKIKQLLAKNNSKKFFFNLIIALCIGILLIIVSDTFLTKENKKESKSISNEIGKNNTNIKENDLIQDYASSLENKLETILQEMNGVENVKVMITLEDTAERVPIFNTTKKNEKTNENDGQGGAREVFREDVSQEVVTTEGDSLMVIKEVKPKVKGVIVVANGAENIVVKEKLYSAVKTVLGISGSKVEVYSSKKGGISDEN